MAYLEARAGIARAGVTYAAWSEPIATFTIGGTSLLNDIRADSFVLQAQLDGPTTATFSLIAGSAPTVGHAVEIKV